MNQAETLITAIGISVLLGSATVFALRGPVRRCWTPSRFDYPPPAR